MKPPLERHLHPPPDHGQPGPLHHRGAGRARRHASPRPATAPWPSRSRPSRPGAARPARSRRRSWPPPRRLARLDVAAALAEWAAEVEAPRAPRSTTSLAFEAEAARHPVVEAAVRRAGDPFTPNDCRLDGAGAAGPRLAIVTGPNMAGKSTFLRQNALLAVLAQAGCFVPAQAAAARRGRPPVQPRRRRRRPRPRPLDLHDRDGRDRRHPDPGHAALLGGAGRDRPRHRHLRRPRHRLGLRRGPARRPTAAAALFATHYHELARLEGRLPHVCNLSMRGQGVERRAGLPARGRPGAADRSYGVQVAKLAGVPPAVVARARAVLDKLESEPGSPARLDDLPLFAARAPVRGQPRSVEDRAGDRRAGSRQPLPAGGPGGAVPAQVPLARCESAEAPGGGLVALSAQGSAEGFELVDQPLQPRAALRPRRPSRAGPGRRAPAPRRRSWMPPAASSAS